MNPQQAINFLNQVTGQISANREVHAQIANALAILNQYVSQTEAEKKAPILKDVKK